MRYKEVDVARPVVEYLHDHRWDVYQEVSLGYGAPTADIVAIQGRLSWVIEVKTSLSLHLIGQAMNYLWKANYVSIAVPGTRKSNNAWRAANELLNNLGIGCLFVYPTDGIGNTPYIDEIVAPKIHRFVHNKSPLSVAMHLDDMQKTYAPAGNSDGKRWTPFKATVSNIERYLSRNPGATMKDIIENVKTHYSSTATARASIAKWINEGVIDTIRAEKDGRKFRYYLKENV